MYKYIGTENQLLDFGFEKCTKHNIISYWIDIDKNSNTAYSIFQILNSIIDIRTDNCLDMISDNALKLFVTMVESGLIVWEE